MAGDAPSDRSIDELFEGARGALIRARAPMTVDPAGGPVLLEVSADELTELRATLRIIESGESFYCMCKGDYAIELRGRFLSKGMLSFHHGISLRLDGWNSDAKLEDGPALFRFLAKRGIEEPLASYEQGLREQASQDLVRDKWIEAVPAPLQPLREELERGGSKESTLAALDAIGRDASAVRAIFRWLALGQGPWSGYPAYEGTPMKLLEAMTPEALIEAASAADLSDAEVRGATRFFGSHEVVSFRKSLLAELPPTLFDRARPIWKALNDDDVMHRFEHMVRLAKDAREAKTRTAPYREGGFLVLAESVNGALSGLAALAGGGLVSVDIDRILRFEPGTVAGTLVAQATEHFVVLAAAGERIAWATMNAGEIHERRGRGTGPIERIASQQKMPVELTAAGEHTAWIERDAPGGTQLVSATGVLAQMSGIHSLVSDRSHVYFIHGGFTGGAIHRVPWLGGPAHRVAAISDMAYSSMAKPLFTSSRGELLVAVKKEIRAVDLETGRSRTLLKSPHPVCAVAARDDRIALIIGEEDGDWFLACAPRDGGKVTKLARFRRAPYHHHPLVIARDHAVTVSNDRLIAAPLA